MTTAARSITKRYSKQNLEKVELLRSALVVEDMADHHLTTLAHFYEGDVTLDNLRYKRNMWFERCRQGDEPATITTLRRRLVDETALKWMIPNMHALRVTYVCLPVSTCEAEHSFSMLRRIHTYMRNSQIQQRLNHCAILLAHRDVTCEMELDGIIDDFVERTSQRMNMFGPN